MMLQISVHYGIHFFVPLVLALLVFKPKWKMAYLVMISTMLIDLDHLLASPIFDPNRCSINFHPLHSYYAIVIYIGLSIYKPSRILGIGFMIHILADTADCLFM